MFEGLFQPMHMLVLFGIAIFVFGPKKIPELGKGLGSRPGEYMSGPQRLRTSATETGN